MKIGIDIQSTLKNPTGIGQYTLGVLKGLQRIDKENQYYLYCRKSFFSRHKSIPEFDVLNFHYKIDRLKRGLSNIIKGVDVLYTPSQHIVPKYDYKFISTIYDLVAYKFPEMLSKDTVERSKKEFPRCLKISDYVIVPSNNTKDDIKEIFGDRFLNKAKVIYPGVDSKFRKISTDKVKKILKKYSLGEDYLLFVGTIEPRKNLVNIIKAMHILRRENSLPGKLVVIGSKGWGWQKVEKVTNKLDMKEEVIFLDYIENDLLPYFYNGAKVFIYPSQYEGFGFPIVEAISCGTPVITSWGSSCEEVAGGAALLVNPFDKEQIAEGILKLYKDEKFYNDLVGKAIERRKLFSWEKTAKNLLDIFESLS